MQPTKKQVADNQEEISNATIQFRERMHAHSACYQEQVAAKQEAEYERAVAARKGFDAARRAWERIVAAAWLDRRAKECGCSHDFVEMLWFKRRLQSAETMGTSS